MKDYEDLLQYCITEFYNISNNMLILNKLLKDND